MVETFVLDELNSAILYLQSQTIFGMVDQQAFDNICFDKSLLWNFKYYKS